jgi:4-carboxymuconolactone decarboxylase
VSNPNLLPPHWPTPLPSQRIAPVPADDRSPETEELLDLLRSQPDREVYNIFSTLAHHPRLLRRWAAFGGTLLLRSELPSRDRELLILRTAWNCQAHYEWVHHHEIARQSGLTEDEIGRVPDGGDAGGWSEDEALLLRAADELHRESILGDATWTALTERYTTPQLIELCMLVGQYHLVAFTLNSLGIQLEDET